MEVMIALVIIAVISGLAVPAYVKTVEQTRGNEALTNLNIIHMGEKIYRLNHGTFWGTGATDIATINTNLSTDMSAVYYTTVSVTGAANNYTAIFTRAGGTKTFQFAFTNGNAAPALTEGGAY